MVEEIINIAKQAGEKILEVYNAPDFDIKIKSDNSPLTKADKTSNELILKRLKEKFPDIPAISEESRMVPFDKRKNWDQFWLVDPLDGTKEFIKKNGEFTVNIALIQGGEPVIGVIYSPVLEQLFFNEPDGNAFKIDGFGNKTKIKVKKADLNNLIAVQSRSHSSDKEMKLYRKLKINKSISVGSSLKLCFIAEGFADIYYRSGPTMEWDVAAGHAILKAAGGKIFKDALSYNKENLKNDEFIALSQDEILQGVL